MICKTLQPTMCDGSASFGLIIHDLSFLYRNADYCILLYFWYWL